MEWEQEDEFVYDAPPPAPPEPPHELDLVIPEIREIFDNILKYRVDPSGDYYNITLDYLCQQLKKLATNNVVAIDIENRFERHSYMYDPILQSFVQGAGGQISTWNKQETSMTPVVLRGVAKRKQMAACREQGRDFYYIDTGYFGNGKKKNYHRITKNDVQNFGPIIDRPGDRWSKCGIGLKKFRPGSKILLAPPSQKLLNLYDIKLDDWLSNTIEQIKQFSDREIVVRLKQGRSTRVNHNTIEMALDQDIHCLVTFSSIAAVEALLYGKPAITLGPNAAAALCSNSISEIENLYIPTLDEVDQWARHLAYCQFSEAEMRDGTAWRILNDA